MKTTKYDHRFYEEPNDGKGGGKAAFEEPAVDAVATGDPEPKVEPKVEPAAPAAPVVDAKALAKEFGEVISKEFAGKKEEAPQLTAEEAKKLLNVWDPSEDWIKRFDNLETRAAAITEMRDGLIRQGDTISQHRLQGLQKVIEEKLTPVLEVVTEIQNRQRDERFDATYQQLAKPALKPLIETVAEQLVADGKKFTSENEMFDAIASGVEVIIKETNPDFKLEKTSGSIPAKKTATGGIPVTTPGAGGGTGTIGGDKTPAKKRGLVVFET